MSLTLEGNQLTSLPAEIGQLASLESLTLDHNQLTSLPAEIGQLASLKHLYLGDNQLTSVPAAIRELRAAGCEVSLDDDVTADSRDDARVLGHGVRCALNCRRGGRRTSNRRIGKG